jgi:surface protein
MAHLSHIHFHKYKVVFFVLMMSCSSVFSQDFITKWKFQGATSEIHFSAQTVGVVHYTWTASPSGNSGSGSFTMSNPDAVILSGLNIAVGDEVVLNMNPTNLRRFYGSFLIPLDIMQWGSVPWSSMRLAFLACTDLTLSATDSPNLANVTDMHGMFKGTFSFNQPINNWNTSNVTDMSCMFYNAKAFNQPLNNWNTSNVTNMNQMFYEANAFNQPIGNWNTSKVESMAQMFSKESLFQQPIPNSFNQPIGNWNTSSVTNMSYMFANADEFNQPIGNWNVSNVINMENMFASAYKFNQPLNNWNTSRVTNMQGVFAGAQAFNQPLNNWNTSNAVNMYGMFASAVSFNQPIGNWNTSNVLNMARMFEFALVFNQNISNWNTSKVNTMMGMFFDAQVYNQPVGNWNTSNVEDMSYMFAEAYEFNQPIGNWNTAKVTTMEGMFLRTSAFNQNINSWNTTQVLSMNEMFSWSLAYNQYFGDWDLHPDVTFMYMLDESGLDCNNWTETIIGWRNINSDLYNKYIGAYGLYHGTNAQPAINYLFTYRNWTFGDFGSSGNVCSNSALPIELLHFNAQAIDKNVLLDWITASEINNEKFQIEHSSNGIDFSLLAEIKSKGNSTLKTVYQYKHQDVVEGIHYYRLKQLDFDGKHTYSNIKKVEINNHSNQIEIYPNPTSGLLNIVNCDRNSYKIADVTGKIVIEGNVQLGTVSIHSLTSGLYFLTVVKEEKTITEKVWKQ